LLIAFRIQGINRTNKYDRTDAVTPDPTPIKKSIVIKYFPYLYNARNSGKLGAQRVIFPTACAC
jgi:hypothetical protein